MEHKNMKVQVSFTLDVEYDDSDVSVKEIIEHIRSNISKKMAVCEVVQYNYVEAKELKVTRVKEETK